MPYLKGMHDKVIHVVIVHQEVAELLGQHLLHAVLLCADEALNHHTAKHTMINKTIGTKLVLLDSTHIQGLCCPATIQPHTCRELVALTVPSTQPEHQEMSQLQH